MHQAMVPLKNHGERVRIALLKVLHYTLVVER